MPVRSSMSLFDSCVSCILNSPYLLARASLFLPKKISHYLLFEACEKSNLVAVKKLVETWPHKELNFDFLRNSLCRQWKETSGSCLEPHEYFGIVPVFHKYASCALTVAVGVFDNLLSHATLEVIDLSCIHVESANQGEFLPAGRALRARLADPKIAFMFSVCVCVCVCVHLQLSRALNYIITLLCHYSHERSGSY